MYIRRNMCKKNAFKINGTKDVPGFLRNSIIIENDTVILDCAEGIEKCNFGEVIAYEKSNATKSGWNCWVVGNADTALVERDGVFYQKPAVVQAELITENIPCFMEKANIIYDSKEQEFCLNTPWGTSKCKIGKGYWVLYGYTEDGMPDANILSISEQSFYEYYVCTKDGMNVGKLSDYHAMLKSTL